MGVTCRPSSTGTRLGNRELARISVRTETSKVRNSRIFLCRNGQYFERWQATVSHSDRENNTFSVDGVKPITKHGLLQHFKRMMELAGPYRDTRDIVPYSLRHSMITQRIMGGLDFREIAKMCGTSMGQIERTCYHLNDAIRLTNALGKATRELMTRLKRSD